MNGATLNLASLKGRPILLNVWATYCGPCKIETPDLVAMYEKYKDNGFIVVGVSFADTAKDMKQFAADYRITYPLLMGTDALESAYETIGIPTSWFIRRDGTINETRVGLGSTDELERSIRALF
jgi:thiol-disulfide isomerase/thioredoxin